MGQQDAEDHREEDGHALVLPLQIGGGAAAHRIGDLLHLRGPHGLALHTPEHGGGKAQRNHRARRHKEHRVHKNETLL